MASRPDGRVLFLTADDVARAMPVVEDRLSLAARAMRALVADAELPPKIAVHPRPENSFAHAMPAFVRGIREDGSLDLLGLKWVSGFPANAAREIPAISATVLLSDPLTGRVRAVLDGAVITAHRTAAVSGVAIREWLGAADTGTTPAGKALRVAIVGAGVQARSHVPVLQKLLPGASLVIADRHLARARDVASVAAASDAFANAESVADPEIAIRGADVVLTMVSFGPSRQSIAADAFVAARLVIAVDYDMCAPAEIARRAAAANRFVVDDRGQYLANRAAGGFAGYPEPVATIGEVLAQHQRDGEATSAPRTRLGDGPFALVTHLGVGVADLVFADAVVRNAVETGRGSWVGGDS